MAGSKQHGAEEADMTVELGTSSIPRWAELEVDIRLRSKVHITALTAQRKVSKLVLDRVGNLLFGDEPSLVVADRICWRVPVMLAFPSTGPVGKVGEVDVVVETGEVLFDQTLLKEIAERAEALALVLYGQVQGSTCLT